MQVIQRRELPRRWQSVLGTIGLGNLLLLVSVLSFSLVCGYFNQSPLTPRTDPQGVVVHPMNGTTWIDWEKQYAEFRILSGFVPMKAEYPVMIGMVYDFSIVPIHIRIVNEGNLTYPSFELNILVEDGTGHIRGYVSARPEVSAGKPVVETIFLYNVPDSLRGQELRIHAVSTIQYPQTLVVDEQHLTVRTFPRIEPMELPRILLFFLAFSTLPVTAFLPNALKQRFEDCWRRMLEKGPRVVALTIILFIIAFVIYWDVVCKFFSFL